jgi:hypothetical protein
MILQLAIEAQYKQCDATINNLTNWLNDVERRLASQESLRETVEEVKKQTIAVKVCKAEKNHILFKYNLIKISFTSFFIYSKFETMLRITAKWLELVWIKFDISLLLLVSHD